MFLEEDFNLPIETHMLLSIPIHMLLSREMHKLFLLKLFTFLVLLRGHQLGWIGNVRDKDSNQHALAKFVDNTLKITIALFPPAKHTGRLSYCLSK